MSTALRSPCPPQPQPPPAAAAGPLYSSCWTSRRRRCGACCWAASRRACGPPLTEAPCPQASVCSALFDRSATRGGLQLRPPPISCRAPQSRLLSVSPLRNSPLSRHAAHAGARKAGRRARRALREALRRAGALAPWRRHDALHMVAFRPRVMGGMLQAAVRPACPRGSCSRSAATGRWTIGGGRRLAACSPRQPPLLRALHLAQDTRDRVLCSCGLGRPPVSAHQVGRGPCVRPSGPLSRSSL